MSNDNNNERVPLPLSDVPFWKLEDHHDHETQLNGNIDTKSDDDNVISLDVSDSDDDCNKSIKTIIGTGDDMKIYHLNIKEQHNLSKHSPVFEVMLKRWKYKSDNLNPDILLPNIKWEVFNVILLYINGKYKIKNVFKDKTLKLWCDILAFAKEYLMNDLIIDLSIKNIPYDISMHKLLYYEEVLYNAIYKQDNNVNQLKHVYEMNIEGISVHIGKQMKTLDLFVDHNLCDYDQFKRLIKWWHKLMHFEDLLLFKVVKRYIQKHYKNDNKNIKQKFMDFDKCFEEGYIEPTLLKVMQQYGMLLDRETQYNNNDIDN